MKSIIALVLGLQVNLAILSKKREKNNFNEVNQPLSWQETNGTVCIFSSIEKYKQQLNRD
jgi:hypothetical protein